MNATTAEAAAQANVTVATIRTWCRKNVIAAVKQAGKWVIDTTSLAHRITLGKISRKPRPIAYTVDTMTAIGGSRWQRNGKDRVYINDWAELAGLDVAYYRTGNVSGATLGGRGIANGRVGKLIGAIDKVWFDTADGRIHIRHYDADHFEIRYLDGERNIVNLVARIHAGIRSAVAAL